MLTAKTYHATPSALNLSEAFVYIGVERSTFYALSEDSAQKFPRPIIIGKSRRWLIKDLDFWLASLAEKRDAVQALGSTS